MTHERRAAQRVHSQHPVTLLTEVVGGPQTVIETTTEDFSSSALRCLCDQPLALFARVEVVIKLPPPDPSDAATVTSVQCDGIVVRQDQISRADGRLGYCIAVFLDHTTREQRAALDQAVAKCLSDDASRVVRVE